MNECITTNPSTLSPSYLSQISRLYLLYIYYNSSSCSSSASSQVWILKAAPQAHDPKPRKKDRNTSYGELRFCVEATLSCCLQLGCLHWMVSLAPYLLPAHLLLFFLFFFQGFDHLFIFRSRIRYSIPFSGCFEPPFLVLMGLLSLSFYFFRGVYGLLFPFLSKRVSGVPLIFYGFIFYYIHRGFQLHLLFFPHFLSFHFCFFLRIDLADNCFFYGLKFESIFEGVLSLLFSFLFLELDFL